MRGAQNLMINHTERTRIATRVTWRGFIANFILSTFKLAAGILGRSSAMIADAFHSFSDSVTDIIVIWGFRIVAKPADRNHNYGHGKVETLSSTLIGIILFLVGVRILYGAIKSIELCLHDKIICQPGYIALIAAAISIVVKEYLYRYTDTAGKNLHSMALVANAWHHRSDALSSIGALLGIGGAIFLGGKWSILDPIAAVVVSLLIIKVAFTIARGGLNELLEASLGDEIQDRILILARGVPGVCNPHHLKTRRIGNAVAIDIHIEVDRTLNVVMAHEIATAVEVTLRKQFGDESFISVHIEPAES
jgi:cation diffusion facilitator family transporter